MFARESTLISPISVHYRPPAWLYKGLLVSHLGAMLCLFPVAIMLWLKILLGLAIGGSMIRYQRDYITQRHTFAPTQLILTPDDEWFRIKHNGDSQDITLLAGAWVHPWLIVLRFVDGNHQSYSYILTADNVDPEVLRQLRVRLRYRKTSHGDKQ